MDPGSTVTAPNSNDTPYQINEFKDKKSTVVLSDLRFGHKLVLMECMEERERVFTSRQTHQHAISTLKHVVFINSLPEIRESYYQLDDTPRPVTYLHGGSKYGLWRTVETHSVPPFTNVLTSHPCS